MYWGGDYWIDFGSPRPRQIPPWHVGIDQLPHFTFSDTNLRDGSRLWRCLWKRQTLWNVGQPNLHQSCEWFAKPLVGWRPLTSFRSTGPQYGSASRGRESCRYWTHSWGFSWIVVFYLSLIFALCWKARSNLILQLLAAFYGFYCFQDFFWYL